MAQERIKVLQLQTKYYIRTSDLHEEVIKALPIERFEVTAAYLKGKPKAGDMVSISEHIKYFEFSSAQMQGLRWQVMQQLYQFCQQQQFDVIICNGFKTTHMVLKLNKCLKVRHCIGIIHGFGDFDRLYRRLDAKLYIDQHWSFVGVSSAVSDYLCGLRFLGTHCGFSVNNVVTINNALDIDKSLNTMLTKTQAKQRLGLNSYDFIFGTIGRLVPVKGHIYLLQALQQLQSKYPQIKLVIVGDGRLQAELQDYIEANNLQQSVILTGKIFNALEIIRAFECFVLSSLSEGLPLVLLEAMIAKVPIIATDVGGVASVVKQHGYLVSAKDSNALAHAMEKMLNLSQAERQTLSEQAYQYLLQQFNIELYHQKYRQLVLSK